MLNLYSNDTLHAFKIMRGAAIEFHTYRDTWFRQIILWNI